MKKLFLLIFMALSFAGMSQSNYIVVKNSDKDNIQKEQSANPKLGTDELYAEYEAISSQLAKTNYYLDKYARQSLTGEVMIIAGSMMLGMAPFINEDTAVLFTLLGTGIGVAGYVVKLTAYNNIKSSRIKYDGFKVSYKL
ncbi:MAG: hypothetical protein IJZ87_05035 [Bacteroidales bacterium]|nr:hypothetical protein [Bacteroidales bacterium]